MNGYALELTAHYHLLVYVVAISYRMTIRRERGGSPLWVRLLFLSEQLTGEAAPLSTPGNIHMCTYGHSSNTRLS